MIMQSARGQCCRERGAQRSRALVMRRIPDWPPARRRARWPAPPVELESLGLAGQRQPDRMEQRLALLPGLLAHARRQRRGTPRDRAAARGRAAPRRARRSLPAPPPPPQRSPGPRARARPNSRTETRSRAGTCSSRSTDAAASGHDAASGTPDRPASAVETHPACCRYGNASAASRAAIGRLQIVAVHPRQLLDVEHAGAVADVLEPESRGQLVERQQLLVRRPATSRSAPDSSSAPPAGSRARGTRSPTSRRGASTAARDRARAPATRARTTGGVQPNASYSSTCRGVFEMWSSPRITCVIPISASSMTTAKL